MPDSPLSRSVRSESYLQIQIIFDLLLQSQVTLGGCGQSCQQIVSFFLLFCSDKINHGVKFRTWGTESDLTLDSLAYPTLVGYSVTLFFNWFLLTTEKSSRYKYSATSI